MRRLMLCIVLCFAIGLSTAEAGKLKPKKHYRVTWEESGGRIDSVSVCADHKRGSIPYRECRSYAVDLFAERCAKHTRGVERSGGRKREKERVLKGKFCNIADRFYP